MCCDDTNADIEDFCRILSQSKDFCHFLVFCVLFSRFLKETILKPLTRLSLKASKNQLNSAAGTKSSDQLSICSLATMQSLSKCNINSWISELSKLTFILNQITKLLVFNLAVLWLLDKVFFSVFSAC